MGGAGWGAIPHCPPPAHCGPALAFSRRWALPRGRLPVPCVGMGGGGSRGSCSPWGSGGPTGRADWWSCRGPGTLPRNCVPALCILPILSAPCPHVTKSLLWVKQCTQPATGSWVPRAPECHVPTQPPRELPLLGMVGQSCFLSLKPSRATGQTAPPSSQKPTPMQGVPGGPLGPGQARGPGLQVLPCGLRPPPLQGQLVLPAQACLPVLAAPGSS